MLVVGLEILTGICAGLTDMDEVGEEGVDLIAGELSKILAPLF